jgi:FAD binding domain
MEVSAELSIGGRVATPKDPDWDEARRAWNLAADQRPEAVALVESAEDVSKTIAFASEHDLRVTAQGTGHGAAPLGPLDHTILIKSERMRGVKVGGKRARVEAGVLAEELGAAAHAEGGQCFLPGSSPNIGVVGYSLGGGLGWLGRRHGFACNRVSAIELVGADGEPRAVDTDNDPDLFWALRGGGGGYAVVTALHVDLLPLSELYGGALLFPAELSAEGLRAYRDWAAGVPEEVTSLARLLHLPPIPDVPEPLRDRPLLYLGVACIGSKEEGQKAIAPLRGIGEPVMDTFDQIATPALSRIAMDPEPPLPFLGDHALLSDLPDDAVDTFIEVAGPESGSPLLLAQLSHLGGALSRPAENAGALDKLDADWLMFGVGLPMSPQIGEAIQGHLDKLADSMRPWAAAGGYFNFAERPCDIDAILPEATCERLLDVKRKWDPDGRIVANHALSLSAA